MINVWIKLWWWPCRRRARRRWWPFLGFLFLFFLFLNKVQTRPVARLGFSFSFFLFRFRKEGRWSKRVKVKLMSGPSGQVSIYTSLPRIGRTWLGWQTNVQEEAAAKEREGKVYFFLSLLRSLLLRRRSFAFFSFQIDESRLKRCRNYEKSKARVRQKYDYGFASLGVSDNFPAVATGQNISSAWIMNDVAPRIDTFFIPPPSTPHVARTWSPAAFPMTPPPCIFFPLASKFRYVLQHVYTSSPYLRLISYTLKWYKKCETCKA